MKISIEYFKEDRYELAKSQLLDPEMALDELGLDVCFNDFGSEIILKSYIDAFKQITHGTTWWEIVFYNDNCFDGFAEECVMTVDLI